jgi:hypothetical protein
MGLFTSKDLKNTKVVAGTKYAILRDLVRNIQIKKEVGQGICDREIKVFY